ncbi:hypothetical protein LXL04_022028 [Taraxacum kok-saghyz]
MYGNVVIERLLVNIYPKPKPEKTTKHSSNIKERHQLPQCGDSRIFAARAWDVQHQKEDTKQHLQHQKGTPNIAEHLQHQRGRQTAGPKQYRSHKRDRLAQSLQEVVEEVFFTTGIHKYSESADAKIAKLIDLLNPMSSLAEPLTLSTR